MAVTKKTIRHVPFGNAVTSVALRQADLDIEYNIKRIEDVLIGEFSQTKATVGGDSSQYFEAASPVDQYDVVTWSYAQANFGQGSSTELTNHTNDTTNPHNATKAQVGLGNVINEAQALPSDLSSHESLAVTDNVHGFVTGAQLVEGTDPEERVRNSDLIGTFKQHEWTAKVHDDLIAVAFEYNGSVAYSLYYPFAIDYYKGTDMLIGPSFDYSLQFEYSSQNNGIHFVNGQNPDVVDMSNFDDTGWNTVNLGTAYDDGLNVTAVSVSPIFGFRYFGTDVGANGSKVYRYQPGYDDSPTVLTSNSDGGLTDLATDPVVRIESNWQNRSWILFPNNLYKMDSGFSLMTSVTLTEPAADMYLTRENEAFVVSNTSVFGYDSDLNEIVNFTTVKDNVGIRVDSFGYIYTLQKTAGVVYIAKYDRSGNKEWEWDKEYNLSYTFDMNAVGYFYLVTDDDMTVVSPRGNIVDQFIGIIENEIVDTTGIDSNYSVKHIQIETSS